MLARIQELQRSLNDMSYLSVTLRLPDIRSIKPTHLPSASTGSPGSRIAFSELKRTARVTVCVIIVKLNESTSVASKTRSCFSRMRGWWPRGRVAKREGWLPLNVELAQGKNPNSRGERKLERLLVSVGRGGGPRGWVGQVRSKRPP